MKQVRFEFEELPYDTLSQFGLTQEMIEDLPMQTLEAISHGRHSPVLPIKVNDENGNTVTERSRFAFVRKENGEADVIFFPVLKKSPLEKYNEEQKKCADASPHPTPTIAGSMRRSRYKHMVIRSFITKRVTLPNHILLC